MKSMSENNYKTSVLLYSMLITALLAVPLISPQ